MKVLSIILGVILVICGVSCMFTPLATFLNTGYFLGIMLFVFGIMGVIRIFREKVSVPEIIMIIMALIIGVIAIIRPGSTLVFDSVILTLLSIWLLVQGVSTIMVSVKARDHKGGWILGVIIGIIAIILGCYSFIHPMAAAVTAGFLIGFYIMEAGLNMLIVSSAIKD